MNKSISLQLSLNMFMSSLYSLVLKLIKLIHSWLGIMFICVDVDFVCPYQVLAELMKSNFTLLNGSIQFDENGDPKYGPFSIVFWNHSGVAEEIGFYHFHPSVSYFINDSKINWNTKGEVKMIWVFVAILVIIIKKKNTKLHSI